MLIQPVVLSGGSGTRLWPLSREKYPKQLLPLIGDDSLLQATVRRVEGLAGVDVAAPMVVSNEEYRFVIAEARSRRDGDPVEVVGTYDPRLKGATVKLKLDRVDYWLGKGAKPTDTVHAMIKKARRAGTAAAAPAA